MIRPEVEELLEALYVHEVENDGYPSAEIIKNAAQDALSLNFIESFSEKYKLTKAGTDAGRGVIRRHRLAEMLLTDVLAVKAGEFEEDACRFEHVLKNDVEEKVCSLLGHPTHCPHGKTIPPGECCQKALTDQIKEVRPLCDGAPDAEGFVAYLATQDNRQVQKLLAMGILPGAKIKVIRRFPSYVFQVGFSQFAVDRSLAELIYIRWDDE
jgi:DtxR family Mn-dependent transcriptional regulator